MILEAPGGTEKLRWTEHPTPEPGPGEVLVQVEACGVNHLDVWVRSGLPMLQVSYPHILGADVAGVLPDGTKVVVSPGISCMRCQKCLSGHDNLCRQYTILGETRHGGNAQYVVVPAANVVPRPATLSAVDAAALPVTFMTAWQMLVAKADVQIGEVVLVLGAGSGVGSAAIQIAKLLGAHIIATSTDDAKLEHAKNLGCDEVINTRQQPLLKAVQKLTARRGVDVVFEHIGKEMWPDILSVCARGGRIVTCGATTGWEATCDLRQVFYKQISILGSTMAPKGALFDIVNLVAQGRLKPIIDKVLPLEEVGEAHRLIESRRVFGKIVLEV